MNKVVFYSYASNEFHKYGQMVKNSFKRFHPDIPFILFNENDLNSLAKTYQSKILPNYKNEWAYWGRLLADEYDLVVRMDADNIICGPLNEVFEGDYEVAGALNNNSMDYPSTLFTISKEDYLSCSFFACRSKRFWDHWKWLNATYMDDFKLIDNDTFNLAFYYGNYKTKILDREKVYYSSSSRDKWGKYRMEGNKVMCEDRIVKVMHRAGGYDLKKLSYREVGFSDEICNMFDSLTQ